MASTASFQHAWMVCLLARLLACLFHYYSFLGLFVFVCLFVCRLPCLHVCLFACLLVCRFRFFSSVVCLSILHGIVNTGPYEKHYYRNKQAKKQSDKQTNTQTAEPTNKQLHKPTNKQTSKDTIWDQRGRKGALSASTKMT